MKLFVVSDVHGFYNEMIAALAAAGFDSTNPDHMLISCGDAFDRGPQPKEVIDYFLSLPNKVLIRGNHEDLFVDCCKRRHAYGHDYHNGTARTIQILGGDYQEHFWQNCDPALEAATPYLNSLVNYYETKNYVFVHSWIPLGEVYFAGGFGKEEYYRENWRESTEEEWFEARWGCPFEYEDKKLYIPDKKIVCGHWHTRDGFRIHPEMPHNSEWDIYQSEHLVALDGCVAASGIVNVFVVEEELI